MTAGKHIITIALGEGSAWLDKIAVKNSRIAPVGPGEEANNICVPKLYTSANDGSFEKNGYALEQNFPNPFSGITSISFEIPNESFVSLKVFDIAGEEVAEFAGKEYHSGKHTLEIKLDQLSSGSYFYTFKTDQFSETRKMIMQAD